MDEVVLRMYVFLWFGSQICPCQCLIDKGSQLSQPNSSFQSIEIQMFQLSSQISTPVLHSVDSVAGQHCRAAAARVNQNIFNEATPRLCWQNISVGRFIESIHVNVRLSDHYH